MSFQKRITINCSQEEWETLKELADAVDQPLPELIKENSLKIAKLTGLKQRITGSPPVEDLPVTPLEPIAVARP